MHRLDHRSVLLRHWLTDVVRSHGIALAPRGGAWWGRCPFHREKTPSFVVYPDGHFHCYGCGAHGDTIDFVRRIKGLNFVETVHALGRDLGDEEPEVRRVREANLEAEQHRRREADASRARIKIERARKLWHSAEAITPDCEAGLYLTAARGFPPPWPPTLRYVPNARHPTGNYVPALVASACHWPDRTPRAVQMTALDPKGRKAALDPQRWTLGTLKGAAVRVSAWREGSPIALTEGVEDALAVSRVMPEWAAWATLGVRNVASVALPEGVDVVFALDGDKSGRAATAEAVTIFRSRGHRVRVVEFADGEDPAAAFAAPRPVESAA